MGYGYIDGDVSKWVIRWRTFFHIQTMYDSYTVQLVTCEAHLDACLSAVWRTEKVSSCIRAKFSPIKCLTLVLVALKH